MTQEELDRITTKHIADLRQQLHEVTQQRGELYKRVETEVATLESSINIMKKQYEDAMTLLHDVETERDNLLRRLAPEQASSETVNIVASTETNT